MCLFSQSENDKLIYMDSSSGKTTKDNHIYYLIIRDYNLKKDNYKIEEYYKSGKLKQEGISTEKDAYKYVGILATYYESGSIQEQTTYKNGQTEGPYYSFYANGNKKSIGEYVLDSYGYRLRINDYWNVNQDQKVVDKVGNYDEVNGKIILSGRIKNGFKEGNWKGFDKILNISFLETYKDGTFISGISTDENGTEHKYSEINERPDPVKGINDFYGFIAKNFKTPENEKITGRLFVNFVVNKYGVIQDIKILRGLSENIDKEALRVVNGYKEKWNYGKSRGIAVDTKYTFPIQVK
jgi:antitoxin component YwqK of YwqJK toxin-antitoxin module